MRTTHLLLARGAMLEDYSFIISKGGSESGLVIYYWQGGQCLRTIHLLSVRVIVIRD